MIISDRLDRDRREQSGEVLLVPVGFLGDEQRSPSGFEGLSGVAAKDPGDAEIGIVRRIGEGQIKRAVANTVSRLAFFVLFCRT